MYRRDPSSEGYSMVYCRSSVSEFRKFRNPSACIRQKISVYPRT